MKKIISLFMLLIIVLTFTACSSVTTTENESKMKSIVDSLGREVQVPVQIDSIGSLGVMRLLIYMQVNDLVVGATDMDNVVELNRPYTYVHPENVNLPVIGQGGAGGIVPFEEEIIKVDPDIIFVSSDYSQPDELSEKIGIPVVAVTNPGLFDGIMNNSISIIGEVLSREERAKEINEFMNNAQNDLNNRTKDIMDGQKQTVYNGGLNFRGKHGFDGTSAKYGPFVAINAKNVADQTGQSGAFNVDFEQILEWNPDIIFVNPENLGLVNEQYNKNPDFFNSLDAVKEGKVYSQMSYNNNYSNIDIALADAYYAGTIIYPEEFEDVNADKKANEIFEFLLGKEIYEDFVSVGQGFGTLTIGD
ncbi:MAG: iron ABC transporter substrate-binding protein [Eubacteriales bacterium]